jgi:hypothetical protein
MQSLPIEKAIDSRASLLSGQRSFVGQQSLQLFVSHSMWLQLSQNTGITHSHF